MKVCPICDTKFDDEILRFCTKDGSPLVDEAQPNFLEIPSESLDEPDDEPNEVTVIRKKDVPPAPPSIDDINAALPPVGERFVVHTGTPEPEPQIRQRVVPAYYPPPQQSNTLKVVALTVFGTVVVLGLGALLFSLFQRDRSSNTNVNLNTNLGAFNGNLNSNVSLNNFNFNTGSNSVTNYNANISFNTNLGKATPSPKPSPSPTATPSSSPSPTPVRTNTNTRPSPSPTIRTGPRPTPNPVRSPADDGN